MTAKELFDMYKEDYYWRNENDIAINPDELPQQAKDFFIAKVKGTFEAILAFNLIKEYVYAYKKKASQAKILVDPNYIFQKKE